MTMSLCIADQTDDDRLEEDSLLTDRPLNSANQTSPPQETSVPLMPVSTKPGHRYQKQLIILQHEVCPANLTFNFKNLILRSGKS